MRDQNAVHDAQQILTHYHAKSPAFDGIRVIELGQVYNGPYCGLLLSLHGAEVIKIEPPGGELLRFRSVEAVETHEFVMLNSNKRSVVIDFKQVEGRTFFERLIKTADVLIENYSPGVMARLGLDPERLMQENPRLIYATGKGYGLAGPYAHMAAMDLTVQAMSGTISSTGFPDQDPVKTGPAFIDFMSGVHLFAGVATALFQRERTGLGQLVEVSMHDTVYPTLASSLGGLYNNPGKEVPERTGNRHTGLAVSPYNVYQARDGHLAIISASERHFSALVDVIGRSELADDERFKNPLARVANSESLDAEINAWTRSRDRWECVELLSRTGVPSAPVLTVREVADDHHLKERGMIREIEHPRRGRVNIPASPIRLSESPVGEIRVAPTLGESTDAVLADLGYLPDAIEVLRQGGAVQ